MARLCPHDGTSWQAALDAEKGQRRALRAISANYDAVTDYLENEIEELPDDEDED